MQVGVIAATHSLPRCKWPPSLREHVPTLTHPFGIRGCGAGRGGRYREYVKVSWHVLSYFDACVTTGMHLTAGMHAHKPF